MFITNMANSTEIVDDNAIVRAEFIQELLPSAERTALLYHLTFLSLGGFPNLERMIRDRAIETQQLFGSSEAVLLKCVDTSSNLVTSLFPMLIKAVEKNQPDLAVEYLMKAKEWIADITKQVEDLVKRYDNHNKAVNTCTSDVYEEQNKTKKREENKSDEMKCLKELKCVVCKTQMSENQMKTFKEEHGHWIKKLVDFFRGYPDAMKDPKAIAINTNLKQLKSSLNNEEWNIKIEQLQLASCQIQMGEIPNPDPLQEAQQCLSRIQNILVDLKMFWEKVDAVLKTLEEKTSTGDEIVHQGEMEDLKEELLSSIEGAAKYWTRFSMSCQRAQGIFSVQSRDAYKFLEINPSSLSEEERKRQYTSVTEKLKKINADPPALSVTLN